MPSREALAGLQQAALVHGARPAAASPPAVTGDELFVRIRAALGLPETFQVRSMSVHMRPAAMATVFVELLVPDDLATALATEVHLYKLVALGG